MKNVNLLVFFLLILAGCNSEEREARLREDRLSNTFTASSFNYTPYILYSIRFNDFSLPFKIDEAASGGSISFRNISVMEMDNGEKIRFTSSNCCFNWSGPVDKPRRVRVVWNVVYDINENEGEARQRYNGRTSRKSAPGSRWCQAVVDIPPATGPERPNRIFFHFLPDGSVQALLGRFNAEKPLSADHVKRHSTPLPEGHFCKQEIENPYYGIPRRPHSE